MAVETTQEQLERVQAAIRRIEEASVRSYTTPDGRSTVTPGGFDLQVLYAREEKLKRQLAREGAGPFVQVRARLDARMR